MVQKQIFQARLRNMNIRQLRARPYCQIRNLGNQRSPAIRINVNTWRVIEVYLVVGSLYLVACYAIAGLLRQVERRFAIAR